MRSEERIRVAAEPGPVEKRGGKEIEGGKVTRRFRDAVDDLLERRADLYRRLAK